MHRLAHGAQQTECRVMKNCAAFFRMNVRAAAPKALQPGWRTTTEAGNVWPAPHVTDASEACGRRRGETR
jgi:hypothetical protein